MDVITKLDVSDVDGYDWNWFAKYHDEIVLELVQAFTASFFEELPSLPQPTVQRIASEWAEVRAADMVKGITDVTKERVRTLVATSVANGESVSTLANTIRQDFSFSPARATSIARTETAIALGEGQKGAAIAQGRDEKRWVTAGDVDDLCGDNESIGWISIADPFPGGVDTVPQHPGCRCVVRYRTKAIHEDSYKENVEFRCSGCNRLLAMDAHKGTRIVCRHCKVERIA
jgi:hypothetical protein